MRLSIEEIGFRYAQSVSGLGIESFQMDAGERVALVGPSGAGKSTLLNLIGGILQPFHGRILLGDTDIVQLSEKERRVFRVLHMGFVYQDFKLVEYLHVLDNVTLPYRLCRYLPNADSAQERAMALLEQLGLDALARRSVDHLSQGERQRVAIARALITRPKILLADEPTGNLDPSLKSEIVNQLLRHSREMGASILMVTHDEALLPSFGRTVSWDDLNNPEIFREDVLR